jgi:hypothetical protein
VFTSGEPGGPFNMFNQDVQRADAQISANNARIVRIIMDMSLEQTNTRDIAICFFGHIARARGYTEEQLAVLWTSWAPSTISSYCNGWRKLLQFLDEDGERENSFDNKKTIINMFADFMLWMSAHYITQQKNLPTVIIPMIYNFSSFNVNKDNF